MTARIAVLRDRADRRALAIRLAARCTRVRCDAILRCDAEAIVGAVVGLRRALDTLPSDATLERAFAVSSGHARAALSDARVRIGSRVDVARIASANATLAGGGYEIRLLETHDARARRDERCEEDQHTNHTDHSMLMRSPLSLHPHPLHRFSQRRQQRLVNVGLRQLVGTGSDLHDSRGFGARSPKSERSTRTKPHEQSE
jgi:hypothetical protein